MYCLWLCRVFIYMQTDSEACWSIFRVPGPHLISLWDFFSSGFLCFLCRVLHHRPAFKAKNKHREFTWGGKDWGFTISYQSKILTNNLITYVGHSQKTRWPPPPARGFEWNQGMKQRRSVCGRYTVKSSLCRINRVIKCRNKNYLKNWLGAKFIRGLSLWHFNILIYYIFVDTTCSKRNTDS